MPLTKQRKGELAMIALQSKLENDGNLKLIPSQIKREVKISSKKTGAPKEEIAEFFKILLTGSFKKTIAELNKIIKKSKPQ